MRKVLIGLLGVALVAGACSTVVSGPQTYSVDVDKASPANEKFQISAFFPGTLKVRPGDTIVFRNRSTEAPHTISFGMAADRKNQPPIITDKGENPVVHDPCYAPAASANMLKCPTKKLPAYSGKGYWNSGFLEPVPAPASMGPKRTTLRIASGTAAGTYRYVCILHGLMSGAIQVVANDDDRVSADDVADTARKEGNNALSLANALTTPKLKKSANSATITAGWGDRITSVNRFGPAAVTVKRGTTVRWTGASPFEPHTVTFGGTIKSPADPRAFAPLGPASGGAYTSGVANSGVFGPKGGPFPPGPYSLKFTKAGTYKYVCVLHPGMDGKIKVT